MYSRRPYSTVPYSAVEQPDVIVLLYLRPDADSIDGGWTNETGGSVLYSSIDESAVNDADYIQSSVNPVVDVAKISLSNPGFGVTEPAKLRYRYKRDSARTADLTVRLLQGTTQIASWTHTGISTSFVTTEQTLTAPQFASITDFDDLYIELTANS
jgi:hypothetical protein